MKNQKQISIKKIITQEPYRSFIKIFDMAYVLDTTGNIVHVTGSIKKNLGYTAKEVINTHFKDYIGIKEIPIALSVFKDIILGKEAKGVTLNLKHKNSNEVKITLNTVPVIVDEKIIGIIGNVTSALQGVNTDHKKTEKKVQEIENKYKTIFESSRDAIMTLVPPNWNFGSANKTTLDLFGAKTEEEFNRLGPGDVSPEKQPNGNLSSDEAKKTIQKAMQEGSVFFDWVHKRLNGEEFFATVLLTKIKLDGEELLQATVRDVSEQKKSEYLLEEKIKDMEKLNRLMIGRELKMIELKNDIKKFKKPNN
jgi:PAS domain S-box-containing protein